MSTTQRAIFMASFRNAADSYNDGDNAAWLEWAEESAYIYKCAFVVW